MHISFVILHYVTFNDTVECVDSIINNIDYKDYSIIIVDNGSQNGSGKKLLDKYSEDDRIDILLNEKNLGFAKGNNLGFIYAKNNRKADFIVMINNDTIIEQKDFCNQILKNYDAIKFDIAGPDIISLVDKQCQNPVPIQFKSISQVKNKIRKFYLLLFLNYLGLDTVFQKIKLLIKPNNKENELTEYQLHGSCLIFAKNYIDKYNGLYDKTFMYCEEDILKYISTRDNLKMKYIKEIKIFHKEDSSTNAKFKKDILKRRFYYKNSINSCNRLKELMLIGKK